MKGLKGFLVLLPGQIIEIPKASNLSWLRMFYALPWELVEKRPDYLELPRNIRQVLGSEEYRVMIRDDSFLELVWDCYAWSAWQFFQIPHKDGTYHDIPGDWKNYSGDFPLWRMSYLILPHFRLKFETEMEWSFQDLFLMDPDDELPWLSYQQFSNLVGNLTDLIVKEQNWQPIFDEIWKNRQPEDYSGKSGQSRDFMRSWSHDRTVKTLSLEELQESGILIGGNEFYDIPNPSTEFETKILDEMKLEEFKRRLTNKDRQILSLRAEGFTQKEIAEQVGYQTPGAVSKRLEKIAEQYEAFVAGEYGEFLNRHVV